MRARDRAGPGWADWKTWAGPGRAGPIVKKHSIWELEGGSGRPVGPAGRPGRAGPIVKTQHLGAGGGVGPAGRPAGRSQIFPDLNGKQRLCMREAKIQNEKSIFDLDFEVSEGSGGDGWVATGKWGR